MRISPNDVQSYYYPALPETFKQRQEEITTLLRDSLNHPFLRGDYKELTELCLLSLTKGMEPVNFTMIYPGALHKAKWMAKLIYSIKIVLLSNQIKEKLPHGEILTTNQIAKLERFMVFTVVVYVPWWIVCSVPENALVNDLLFIQTLEDFTPYDYKIVEIAKEAFERHTWYITEELTPLALFSSQVEESTKENMRKAIISYKGSKICKRVGLNHGGYGKPYLPPISEGNTSIVELVGPESCHFFEILGLPYQFIHSSVSEWQDNCEYLNIRNVVNKIQVVNDAAERGVKLSNDFLHISKNELQFQQTLQVVENDRFCVPNQRKRSTNKE